MYTSKNVTVIVNKSWETEPLLNAMTNQALTAKAPLVSHLLPFPLVFNSPKNLKDTNADNRTSVRARFQLSNANTCLNVSVWCIEDLMDPTQNASSSEEKFRVLPSALVDSPDLVVSVSTANCPYDTSMNGSVLIGANSFLYNGCPGNPLSNLQPSQINQLLPSNVNADLFTLIDETFNAVVIADFLTPPNFPAQPFQCIASDAISVVSSINVTDYTMYTQVDEDARNEFNAVVGKDPDTIETTHGVVKISTKAPIIFISPVTDRFGHFADDVSSVQNYVAAFNGGVVLRELLWSLCTFVDKGNEFAKR
jgi:hypothetical protein